jgi:hypothetical protein
VFLAQADGISEELFSGYYFIRREFQPAINQLLQNGQLTDSGRLLLDPLVQSGTIGEDTRKLLGQNDHLNRHAVLHGMDMKYATETNALKSISLLAYFSLVENNQRLNHQPLQKMVTGYGFLKSQRALLIRRGTIKASGRDVALLAESSAEVHRTVMGDDTRQRDKTRRSTGQAGAGHSHCPS